jgi:Mitochondrial carrier protein
MSIDATTTNLKLTPAGNLLAGALTSCVNISLFHPLYTIKTCLMSGEPLAFKYIYRGFTANLLCDVSYQGALFCSYGIIEKEASALTNRQLLPLETSLCGFLAGTTVSPLISYLERVMIIQQIAHDTLKTDKMSLVKVATTIHKAEGISGLSRGLVPTILRESFHSTCFFGLSKLFKKSIAHPEDEHSLSSHISYLMAGATAGLITTPFDLVKTKMQNHVSSSHLSMIKTVDELTSGFKKLQKLFTGASARVATVSTTMLGMGFFSEKMKALMPSSFQETKNLY